MGTVDPISLSYDSSNDVAIEMETEALVKNLKIDNNEDTSVTEDHREGIAKNEVPSDNPPNEEYYKLLATSFRAIINEEEQKK